MSAQDKPRLYISYAHEDVRWCDRVLHVLQSILGERAEILFDHDLKAGDNWQKTINGWIESAEAIVLLVSESYLASEYIIGQEVPHLLQRAESGVRLLWIAVSPTAWESSPLVHYQAVNDVAHPLSTLSDARLEHALHSIGTTIAGALGLDVEPSHPESDEPASPDVWHRLSPSSQRSLALANALRLAAGQDRVHMEHLIVALQSVKEGAPMAARLADAGISSPEDLVSLLKSQGHLIEDYRDISQLDSMPALSTHARAAVDAAVQLADAQKTQSIHSRQLTYGALSVDDCQVIQLLRSKGVRNPVPELKEPSPTPTEPELDVSQSGLAGFEADTVAGTDQLGVSKEALTLAMLVAHEDVQPPISVGLFGDWGSGKSFFMRQMKHWIQRLSRESQAKDGAYCKNIVQLEFNAWHYMDSNLWASLAREIFEGLANAVADKEAPALQEERLRRATQSTKDVITAKESEIAAKRAELQATDRRLEAMQEAPPSQEDVAQASLHAVLKVPEIGDQVRDAARQLNLVEAGKTLGELKQQADELRGLARYAKALVLGFGTTWPWGLLGFVLVLGLYLGFRWALFEGLDTKIVRLTALLASIAATVAPVLAAARTILSRISHFQQSVKQEVDAKQEAKTREIQAEVEARGTELTDLQEQLHKSQADLQALEKELESLQATQQIVHFIRQRDASSDYRSRLGLVARAHQDFRHLSQLMEQVREQAKAVASGKVIPEAKQILMPGIDRIVLYIDDLDRCPEDKVVDVLQAVHLLLAFPLFVVVVGVDPRWLLHSLKHHSGVFDLQEGEESGLSEPELVHWRSTPLNYLEKIFQIPYTLRPMTHTGFERLVDNLTAAKAGFDPGRASRVVVPPQPGDSSTDTGGKQPLSERRQQLEGPALDTPPVGGPARPEQSLPPDAVSEPPLEIPIDLHPNALKLDDVERQFMKRLFDLIPSPRAVKRFVNVYQLIRASIDDSKALRTFVRSGEYQCVQILLAMVTGAPAQAAELLRELLARTSESMRQEQWWLFVDSIETKTAEPVEWAQFQAQLQQMRARIPETPGCELFRKWADDVARYSFYSGRVLLSP